MHSVHGIHRQLAPRLRHTHHDHTDEQLTRAQRLAMRYDILKERLTSLHSEPRKNMQAIDGVIALLARTQLHLKSLKATQH